SRTTSRRSSEVGKWRGGNSGCLPTRRERLARCLSSAAPRLLRARAPGAFCALAGGGGTRDGLTSTGGLLSHPLRPLAERVLRALDGCLDQLGRLVGGALEPLPQVLDAVPDPLRVLGIADLRQKPLRLVAELFPRLAKLLTGAAQERQHLLPVEFLCH